MSVTEAITVVEPNAEVINWAPPDAAALTDEQLGQTVAEALEHLAVFSARLKPYYQALRDRFRRKKSKSSTIYGCKTWNEYCDTVLRKTKRGMNYFLAGGNPVSKRRSSGKPFPTAPPVEPTNNALSEADEQERQFWAGNLKFDDAEPTDAESVNLEPVTAEASCAHPEESRTLLSNGRGFHCEGCGANVHEQAAVHEAETEEEIPEVVKELRLTLNGEELKAIGGYLGFTKGLLDLNPRIYISLTFPLSALRDVRRLTAGRFKEKIDKKYKELKFEFIE